MVICKFCNKEFDNISYFINRSLDRYSCPECGHVFSICDNCTEEFDFCPHCGEDMREES